MIVKSIILAVSKNGNFVILSVMIGKRETCEIVLISQEMKSKKGGSHEKKNFISNEQSDNGWMYLRNFIRCSQRSGK